jgi:glucan phosphorylase
MRIMLDECGYEWDAAWDIVKKQWLTPITRL